MQQIIIRGGDTLYAQCQLIDDAGVPVSLADLGVTAQLIDRSGNIAHTFGITIENESQGRYSLNNLNTSTLLLQKYSLQISYQLCASTISATVIELNVVKRIISDSLRFANVGSVIGNTSVLVTVPPCEVVQGVFMPLGSSSLITSDNELFLI